MEINPEEEKWFWSTGHQINCEMRYLSISLKGPLASRSLRRDATTQYLARHGFSGPPWNSGSYLTIDIWEKKWVVNTINRIPILVYPSQVVEYMSKKSNTHKVDAKRLGII
jgi:hypothetical protein